MSEYTKVLKPTEAMIKYFGNTDIYIKPILIKANETADAVSYTTGMSFQTAIGCKTYEFNKVTIPCGDCKSEDAIFKKIDHFFGNLLSEKSSK